MKTFDLIVVGAGSGLHVSSAAAAEGWEVAVIDEGPFGGTCLNRGCIPSKMLIHAADVAEAVQTASRFSIRAKYRGVDFSALVDRVSRTVDKEAEQLLKSNKNSDMITVFQGKAKFTEKKVIEVNGEEITAEHIVIAAGGRPFVPPIDGVDQVDYLTSKEALRLKKLPKSMVVIGGGYISAELSHFFGSLGTKITIIERNSLLLSNEDEEIAKRFTDIFKEKFHVILNGNAEKISKTWTGIEVEYQDLKTKEFAKVKADKLLMVVGRKSNADRLGLKEAGYELTERGYVKTDEKLCTSVKGVYALGDIAGKWFFKHSANLEAAVVAHNLLKKKKVKADYTAMPHAVFSSPQVAGVGKTEQELKEEGTEYKKAVYAYKDTGMGLAFRDEDSFVKVLADKKGETILGCHIIGPEASTLIHEVIPIMKMGGKVADIANTVHVHPALPEVVMRAFAEI